MTTGTTALWKLDLSAQPAKADVLGPRGVVAAGGGNVVLASHFMISMVRLRSVAMTFTGV